MLLNKINAVAFCAGSLFLAAANMYLETYRVIFDRCVGQNNTWDEQASSCSRHNWKEMSYGITDQGSHIFWAYELTAFIQLTFVSFCILLYCNCRR